MVVRRTSTADEPAFVRLLRAVYGETYAYRELYAPGGFPRLLASGRVLSFGDFDADGELFSHTAFLLKDPRGDYVESGMSLRNPWLRSPGRTPDDATWAVLFAAIPPGCAYVHQNTTTGHPLAQRYARRHLRARPTGLVADYTLDERLIGVATPGGPMQALTMTTALRAAPAGARVVRLPACPWTPWLAERFAAWGRPEPVAVAPAPADIFPCTLTVIEDNPAIGLRRRALDARPDGAPRAPLGALLADARPRTDLVHLPTDHRAAALPALLAADYVPVGVRPHATRPDEVVLQHLPPARRPAVARALRDAHVLGDDARRLIAGWIERCAPTS